MSKEEIKKEVSRLEYSILEIEMKENLDSADHSLICYYKKQIEELKKHERNLCI